MYDNNIKDTTKINEPLHEKTNNMVSEQVQHKMNCTSTKDGYRLEISDLKSRGIVLSVYSCSENKGADQLHCYCDADLRLCLCKCEMLVFS